MHILQAGTVKSGNLWLYKILDHIFSRADLRKKNFVKDHPIYPLAKTWSLSYPEQAGIDMLDIQNEQCYWRISTIFSMPIENMEEYVSRTSHVWTHSRICRNSPPVYSLFDKIVYIIRDPRDRAVSEAKFAFSEYMQRFSPCSESTFEEYLENNLEAMMNRWRWHVYDHLRYADKLNIHVIFYERLLHNFKSELDKLLAYLETDLSEADRKAIAQAVSFSSMKEESPDHLWKGTWKNWETHFSEPQKSRALSIIQPLISYLNYHNSLLPHLPEYVDKEFLENKVHEIGRK